MTRFVNISPRVWQLTGDMSQLPSVGYERIIRRIASQADIVAHHRERAKHNSNCFRAYVKLKCRAETISLFHSSRSGHWLRANARRERNLSVKRWLRAQADDDRERRKRARWATLTPSSELCLELKGGFLSLSGKPVGFFKQTRSRDLRELGFT